MTFADPVSISSAPNGQIMAFDRAELRRGPFQEDLFLWVSGPAAPDGMDIILAPRIYDQRPDYWGIEVAAIRRPVTTDTAYIAKDGPFEISLPLAGITGHTGISVIGANRIQTIAVSG